MTCNGVMSLTLGMSIMLTIISSLFFTLFTVTDAAVNTTYMSTNCRTSFYGLLLDRKRQMILDSMVLELMPPPIPTHTEAFTCVSTYAAQDPSMRLLLHIEELKINYHPHTVDRLQIYDGLTVATPLSPDQGLFGDYRHNDMGPHNKISKGIYDYVSTNRALTLSYVGKPTKHFPGFKVLITAFRAPNQTGSCGPSMSMCRNNYRCVFSSVRCDGHQNCGDNDSSDEEECVPHKIYKTTVNIVQSGLDTMDLGLIMACIIGIFILLVVVLWLSVLCIKRKRLQRHLQDVQTAARGMLTRPSTLTWPRGFRIPQLAFFQPPPMYTEHPPDYSTLDPRLDPPPPYTTLDRRAPQEGEVRPPRPARVIHVGRRRGQSRPRPPVTPPDSQTPPTQSNPTTPLAAHAEEEPVEVEIIERPIEAIEHVEWTPVNENGTLKSLDSQA